MNWQKIDFTIHQISLGVLDKILKEFMDATLKPNISMDKVGVFDSKFSDKKMSLFFTPNATTVLFPVIALYDSTQCNKPSKDEIGTLLFGSEECWALIL
jgi:hypothetical protein